MAKKRIVVTGMGIVSCFGTDVEEYYNQLLAGHSGIVPIEEFPCSDYPTRFAGCIRNFDPGEYMDKKQARRVDPFIRYAMVAGKKALESGALTGEAFAKLDKTCNPNVVKSAKPKIFQLNTSVGVLIVSVGFDKA